MKRAIIIIDMQNGLESTGKKLYEKALIIEKINKRIQFHRKNNFPIIFIQHENSVLIKGSYNWQLFDTIDAIDSDYFISKTHANSFYDTTLQETLAKLSISELEFCGAQTEYCVDTTIRMAHGLGYSCSMQKGTCTTLDSGILNAETIINHHESIWENSFLSFI
ncbi:nicotinamidase-related amidase [Enterococcus rivorum]|uniref:Amidase n=2 Tax=Enterococcus rivorum TaxID=762845 RepID=A0A1E5KVW1_9ENTE|nr:cysteine hydrolase family protein [Enterococcus rivorum]MBP2100279.1 nicotinamidase-related amidase [Enterococcus rivorum]OEH82002.1 amidase [Enterococcus rivorum]